MNTTYTPSTSAKRVGLLVSRLSNAPFRDVTIFERANVPYGLSHTVPAGNLEPNYLGVPTFIGQTAAHVQRWFDALPYARTGQHSGYVRIRLVNGRYVCDLCALRDMSLSSFQAINVNVFFYNAA